MIGKYERCKQELEETGVGRMKSFGGSMTPIFPSNGVMMTFEKRESYEVGDIVFCKVKGRWIDAHLVTKVGEQGYLISNNHGHDNGWTRQIFGKVVRAEWPNQVKTFK